MAASGFGIDPAPAAVDALILRLDDEPVRQAAAQALRKRRVPSRRPDTARTSSPPSPVETDQEGRELPIGVAVAGAESADSEVVGVEHLQSCGDLFIRRIDQVDCADPVLIDQDREFSHALPRECQRTLVLEQDSNRLDPIRQIAQAAARRDPRLLVSRGRQ